MAALMAGCPDDGTAVTTSDESSSSESGDGPTTNATVTQTTTMDTTADTTADSSGSESTDTDATTTTPTTDTDESSSGEESSSSESGGPACGDDAVDKGEECDGSDLAGQDCASQGFDGGTLACADDCTFDTSACFVNCGNGTIEDPETCDGKNLDGADCLSLGFDEGTLACALDCQFDTSACVMYSCGDGMINEEELCDGADVGGVDCVDQGFDGGALGCAANCMEYDLTGCFNGFPCQDEDIGSAFGDAVAGGNLGGEDDDINAGCGGAGGADRVLAFTVPADGQWTFDTVGSNFDTKLALYTDCSTEVVCNDDTFGVQSQVQADLLAGQEILIVVDGFNGAIGDWVLNINPPPACGDGLQGGMEQCDGADLNGADCVSQGFGGGGVLACDAMCAFDTSGCIPAVCGNDVLEVPEACDGDDLNGLTCIELGVQPSGAGLSNCCFNHQPAAGCDDMACQDIVCAADPFCCDNSWDNACARQGAELCDPGLCPDPTCNGSCDGFDTIGCNTDLACVEQSLGSATGAAVASGSTTGEDEDIAQSCGGGGAVETTLNWVAPLGGTYVFDLVGSDYDTVLQLYSDCSAASSLACNDDALPGAISQITIDLVAGQSVVIAVSGFGGDTGNWVLNIAQPVDPGPLETFDGCDAAFCTFTPGAGPNGGDLCSCSIPGNNHPEVNDYGDASCFGGTPATDMLWGLNMAGYTSFSVTTCNVGAGDSAIAAYDNDPALGGVQFACSEDAAGEPGFCSEITDSGSGVAQGTPTPVPASGEVWLLIDEWNPGNFWNGATTRQLDFEAIP